ncbi:MAG TPA: hydroxymethylbilane synthase [Stackebrandtia sp.]|nr:hydroxymethylbilane synthase [Stackebrandtia sp.]HZE38621.1 hydroxymethylbilane synthase [Stackebrandtia sp.]
MSLVRIGTRSSPMALAQAERVSRSLRKLDADLTVEVVPLTTSGDRWTGPLSQLGGKGAFIKEVDAALLDGRCDVCVHCVKDIPGDRDLPEGTVIAAHLERDDVRDAVVSPTGAALSGLPDGARVGTSSPRRLAQLALEWPTLRPLPIRGNANTRLAKLDAGDFDALLLAVAGLERIGLQGRISEILDIDTMLPAVGAGTLALQIRHDDTATADLVTRLDDAVTTRRTTAERTMLRALQGHCHSPIAGYATVEPDGRLSLHGRVMDPDGSTILDARAIHADAEVVGSSVADDLLSQGARKLIDAL